MLRSCGTNLQKRWRSSVRREAEDEDVGEEKGREVARGQPSPRKAPEWDSHSLGLAAKTRNDGNDFSYKFSISPGWRQPTHSITSTGAVCPYFFRGTS